MKRINLFYLSLLLVGALIWHLHSSLGQEVVSFYGFAENKETEINFNYPVVIRKIHVSPGERVEKGAPLLDIYRIKSKETLSDQPFRIAELRAKAENWSADKRGAIKLVEVQKQRKLAEIEASIQEVQEEQRLHAKLYEGLQNIDPKEGQNSSFAERIRSLEEAKRLATATFDQEIQNLEAALKIGNNPYFAEIERLKAEQDFEEDQKVIDFQLTAPTDGLIGTIYCKEAEHIPSYKTLLSFYEPNPSLVKGFIQEDLMLQVAVNDSFLVRSTKDPDIAYYGKVTGLGSRIVEIPERLRKMPNLKTYGRELLITIPENNAFLQKEKTILELQMQPGEASSRNGKKSLVDLNSK